MTHAMTRTMTRSQDREPMTRSSVAPIDRIGEQLGKLRQEWVRSDGNLPAPDIDCQP